MFTMALAALALAGILHSSIILLFYFAVTMVVLLTLLTIVIYWHVLVVKTFLQGSTTVLIFPAEMLSAITLAFHAFMALAHSASVLTLVLVSWWLATQWKRGKFAKWHLG